MGSPYDTSETMDRRRTMMRSVLFMIILGTLPFYLIGFWLWGTAPDADAQNNESITQESPLETNTPLGQGQLTEAPTLRPTSTPFPTLPPLQFTPPQYQPPVIQPTNVPVIIPTSTTAPSLTPLPSNTPFPTNTSPPRPTDTPFLPPTDTPPPAGGAPGDGAPPPPVDGPPGSDGGGDSGDTGTGGGPPGGDVPPPGG